MEVEVVMDLEEWAMGQEWVMEWAMVMDQEWVMEWVMDLEAGTDPAVGMVDMDLEAGTDPAGMAGFLLPGLSPPMRIPKR